MATFMYVLRPEEKIRKVVCPDCHRRGEVTDGCRLCHGAGVKSTVHIQFKVKDRPIEIIKIDRDPKTGILRYWENQSEFFYETTTYELNKNIPDVPYGVHLCHDTSESAHRECDRINKYLRNKNTMKKIIENLPSAEDSLKELIDFKIKEISGYANTTYFEF
jgi:RecJ-like exonuclease